jgi:hypothetical protein
MVCMEHFQHFRKQRLSLKLESATPAVDQPVAKVSERDDVVSLSEVNFGPQLPHFLFYYIQNKTKDLQTKRNYKG